jgi:hypothetical protein
MLLANAAFGQEDDPFEYGREFLFGVSKTTNSGLISGGFIRFSSKVTEKKYRAFAFEVANIRHPQELRLQQASFFNTASFAAGKENYLVSTRFSYGLDYLLFKKAEQKGVQINGILLGGPSLGLVTPYLLRTSSGEFKTYSEVLGGSEGVVGPAGYFARLCDTKVNVGLHVRGSLLFEFGAFKSNITGFEVGFLAELFQKEIIMVPEAEKNFSFYPSAFISIVFGSRK